MLSRRRSRRNVARLPVIDLGELLGIPRPPPRDRRQRLAQEKAGGTCTASSEKNAAENTARSNNSPGRRQDASAARHSKDKQAPRKRPAARNQQKAGNHYEKLACIKSGSIGAALGGDSDSHQSDAPIQISKPAAVTSPRADGACKSTVTSKTSAYATPWVSQDVLPLSNAGKAIIMSSSKGMNCCVPSTCFSLCGPLCLHGNQSNVCGLCFWEKHLSLQRAVHPCNGKNNKLSTGKIRCVPLIPTPVICFSMFEEAALLSPVSFQNELVNYPQYVFQEGRVNEGVVIRNCVMCGKECCFVEEKNNAPRDGSVFMLKKDNGACSICRDHVWQVAGTKMEVRRCERCRKWYPWAAFRGESRMVHSCHMCREWARARRQRLGKL